MPLSRMAAAEKSNRRRIGSESKPRQEFGLRKAGTDLRPSKGWCCQLFEASSQPMFVYDAGSLAILAANPAALRQFGYARSEFLAHTLQGICSTADVQPMLESAVNPCGDRQEAGLWRYLTKAGMLFQARTKSQKVQFERRDARLVSLEACGPLKSSQPPALDNVEHPQQTVGISKNVVWLMGLDGRITQCNQAACELLRKTKAEIIGRLCGEIVHCSAAPTPDCPYKRVLSSHQRETTVLTLGARWYQVSVDPLFLPSGELRRVIHTMRDITESKEIETALRHSERLFRELANAMPQLVWIANPAGVVSYYNDRVTDHSNAEANGSWDWRELVHPSDRTATLTAWDAAANSARPYTMQHRMRMADGKYRWHLSRAIPVKHTSGAVLKWFGTATDIHDLKLASEAVQKHEQKLEQRVAARTTELVRARNRLRKEMAERTALQLELFTAGERERERLGRDLHDGLCQLLAGIRFKTEGLKGDLETDSPPAAHCAEELYNLLTRAMREARGLARGLQPVAPVSEGLMNGLLELASSTRELYGVQCECSFPQPVRLRNHQTACELYRVAQEAVSNAARHGKPTVIRIRLNRAPNRLDLTIANDGKPFPTRAGGSGMGLKTMRARAKHIGAKLVIGRDKSGGALVRCSLTLRQP